MLQSEDFKHLLGKTVEEANSIIPNGFFININENNGESFYRRAEFNPRRICVIIRNNIITKIDGVF